MLAIRILSKLRVKDTSIQKSLGLLLLVVLRICKYMRVKATSNAIATHNNDSMLKSFQEFIIKDDLPLSIIDFSMTMGHECSVWALSTQVLSGEGFKCIWELSFKNE
jgi:hypothetical protein